MPRDESVPACACDIPGCDRVAIRRCETDQQTLRLCQPCTRAFIVGVGDFSVGVLSSPIERETRHPELATEAEPTC